MLRVFPPVSGSDGGTGLTAELPMPSRSRLVLCVIAVGVIVAGVVVIARGNAERPDAGGAPMATPVPARDQPNVLVIMTDDQTLESMRVMEHVNRLITAQGSSFTNYFVSYPNCCPSRATYLSGQYNHNNVVLENVAPAGGFHKLNQQEYLPVWLQRAGYWTASVGKYLNEYGQNGDLSPPPGWSRWYGLIDPTTYRYYDYDVSEDGRRRHFGSEPEDYQTDVLGAEVLRIIEERAAAPEPWFVSWTPLAPHAVQGESGGDADRTIAERIRATFPVPAPEFEGRMAGEVLPRSASFNEADVEGKPAFIRERQRFFPATRDLIEEGYRRELESLLSVDKWVRILMDALIRTDQATDTVVIFTSDNGYFHGQHRLAFNKIHLYEPAVHLPLVIRGPGFARGVELDALSGNVDLTPTILALAGADATLTLDGRDLGRIARDPSIGRGRGMLLENWRQHGQVRTAGIRTDRYKYLVHPSGEVELYDLRFDPDELDNRAGDEALADVEAELARRFEVLRDCVGATCEGAAAPA
jgi:N-acetylglucosamine-6-sulfatase